MPEEKNATGGENSCEPSELTELQERLNPAQLKALIALLNGANQKAAAAKAGVSRQALNNWQRNPHFRAALREGREALLRETTTLLHARSGWASELLCQLAEDEGSAGYVRVAAARAVIDLAAKTAATDDHAARLSDIEERLAAVEGEEVPST